jgi:hypothetical protein
MVCVMFVVKNGYQSIIDAKPIESILMSYGQLSKKTSLFDMSSSVEFNNLFDVCFILMTQI